MSDSEIKYFFSYARKDQKVVLDLAQRLRELNANFWIDQLDLLAGQIWDDGIEEALEECPGIIVILSPASVSSQNVKDEVSFARRHKKKIIPVLIEECNVPYRIDRLHRVDFTIDKDLGFANLLKALNIKPIEKKRVTTQETANRKAKDETDRKAKEEADSRVQVEAKRKAKVESDRKAKAEAKRKAKVESDRKAKAEAKRKAQLEAERQAQLQVKNPSQAAPAYSAKVKGLLQELENIKTEPPRRLEIGNQLDAIGDPRIGVGLDQNGLPDIDWVKIPAGSFLYQDDENLYLNNYYMSRYPITNQQFQAFVKARGYEENKWWKDLEKPDDLPNHEWTQDNRPVERVSWYDAMAFCRWLSAEQGYEIRLPTEQEWEKAARGTDGRDYPWSNSYKTGFANIDENYDKPKKGFMGRLFSNSEPETKYFYLEETTATGMYPQGESPYGLLDMSGNVWEWCLNKYDEPSVIAADVSGGARSVRGGSWNFLTVNARASFRSHRLPDGRRYDRGFRVVCFSPITDH